jgi:hypothetical protein
VKGDPDEIRTEDFAVDFTGAPLIVQCPVQGCQDLDLVTAECLPGVAYLVTCGAGHSALLMRIED